jgi:hypothetical protein
MERFDLKKLNKMEGKEQLESEIHSHLWKIYALRWILMKLGKLLELISTFQPK